MKTRRSARLSKDSEPEAEEIPVEQPVPLSPAIPPDNANAKSTTSPKKAKPKSSPSDTVVATAASTTTTVRRFTRRTNSSPVTPQDDAASPPPLPKRRTTRAPTAPLPEIKVKPAPTETVAHKVQSDDTGAASERSHRQFMNSNENIATGASSTPEDLQVTNTEIEDVSDAKENVPDAKEAPAPVRVSSLPPPILEIVTTPPAVEVSFSTAPHAKDHHILGSGPKYLDETTLTLVKNYLVRSKGDVLDEEDVVDVSMRLNRAANQRARYHTMAAGKAPAKPTGDVSDDGSDVGSDDTSIYDECLDEEEEQAMGHELLKTLVTTLEQQKSSGPSPLAPGAASRASLTNGHVLLDKKTLTWLKRAVGLHRSETRNIIKQHESVRSRFTRRQAQESRHKKRERGLDILGDAIADLELEYGPFPVREARKVGREKKKSRRAKEADLEEEHAADRRHKRKSERLSLDSEEKRRKKAKEEKAKDGDTGSKDARPPKHKLMLNTVPRPTARSKDKKEKSPTICTSLRLLDWQWRDRTQRYRNPPEPIETPAAYRARRTVALHPQLKAAGVVHRLPHMHAFGRHHEKSKDVPERVYDPPRRRHTDQQYAELCSQLMNCLQGHARLFATCEFFYSDLDREWYNFNSFAADAFKLGIPRDAKLTMTEWKAVRRLIRRKPRLFSRQFIASQRTLRNEYRSNVRLLQNNPHVASKAKLPYNVYFPIRVGSMVTAYNKRFRIIQRGRVLTFDRSTALYLIEFENRHFGFELCPDSDVATSGPPDIMVRSAQYTVLGNPATNGLDMPISGSGTGPIPGLTHLPSLKVDGMLDQLLTFVPSRKKAARDKGGSKHRVPSGRPKPLHEEVANHAAFVTLLEMLDKSRNRKWDFLTLIEDATNVALQQEESGTDPLLSSAARDHMRWLRANLNLTDSVLRTTLDYLRTLYGDAFLRSNRTSDVRNDPHRRFDFVEKISEMGHHDTNPTPLAQDWTVNLVAQTRDVANSMASRIMIPSRTMRPTSIQVGNATVDLKGRVTSAAQLLCTLAYVMNVAETPLATEASTALAVASSELTRDVFPRDDTAARPPQQQLYDEVLDARDEAATELNDALALLKAELELTQLQQSLSTRHH